VTFLGLLELDEGVKNPLLDIPAGKEFLENIKNWVVEPPIREELSVVGSYQSVGQPVSGRR
jgi:small-conductance mechanosensitive channel